MAPTAGSPEKTFSAYTSDQGAIYAQARSDYHPNFYKRVIDYHASTGGQFGTVIDVGCGPGKVARTLAPRFEKAVGFDPSEGMITTAKGLGGISATGRPIDFIHSSAERLDCGADTAPVPNGTADLIVAATAAHWFDMSKFWPRVAQLLRPGGTVAIWSGYRQCFHPSLPNAEAIESTLTDIHDRELGPYMEPGNIAVANFYRDLPLPWDLMPDSVHEFDRNSFYRREWGSPGQYEDDVEGQEFFAVGQQGFSLDALEVLIGTYSFVTRWREANPDKAGTEEDVLRRMRREMERLLHEAGVPEGKEVAKGRVVGVLMMIKKRS